MLFVMILVFIFILLMISYFFCHFKRLYNLTKLSFKLKMTLTIITTLLISFLAINIFNVIGIIVLHWFVFSVITDLVFYVINKISTKRYLKLQLSSIIPICLTIIVMLYGYYNMTNVIEHKETIISFKELKQDYDILFISDLHYKTTMDKKKLDKIVDDINQKEYDLAILGGDIVDESTTNQDLKDVFNSLGNIKTKYGIYYVYGNHDEQNYSTHRTYSKEELKNVLTTNNITLLSDTYQELNDDIIIYGRDEISRNSKRQDSSSIIKDLDQSKYLLIVDHQPLDISKNANLGFDMQLSGHTHAGQIFPAGIIIKLFINEVAYGHEKIDNLDVIVSSGMAGWAFPIRTSDHSEYVSIHLQNKA